MKRKENERRRAKNILVLNIEMKILKKAI